MNNFMFESDNEKNIKRRINNYHLYNFFPQFYLCLQLYHFGFKLSNMSLHYQIYNKNKFVMWDMFYFIKNV